MSKKVIKKRCECKCCKRRRKMNLESAARVRAARGGRVKRVVKKGWWV